jgi:hypothetical protein
MSTHIVEDTTHNGEDTTHNGEDTTHNVEIRTPRSSKFFERLPIRSQAVATTRPVPALSLLERVGSHHPSHLPLIRLVLVKLLNLFNLDTVYPACCLCKRGPVDLVGEVLGEAVGAILGDALANAGLAEAILLLPRRQLRLVFS